MLAQRAPETCLGGHCHGDLNKERGAAEPCEDRGGLWAGGTAGAKALRWEQQEKRGRGCEMRKEGPGPRSWEELGFCPGGHEKPLEDSELRVIQSD